MLRVATAAVNELRSNHYVLNTVTGLYEPSVLMEGSRTNSQFPSNDLTSANYSLNSVTVTGSATTGPDGVAASAAKVVEAAATSGHSIQKSGGWVATASTVQSASVYAKAAERTWMSIFLQDGAGASLGSYVNLATGALGTVNAAHTIKVEALANGWYRVTCSWNSNVGGGNCRANFGPTTGDAVASYLGDGVSGIYLSGYQVEADQPFSSSYIPTVGGTVTRSADSYSVPFTTPPQAMTLYSKFKETGTAQLTSFQRIVQIGGAGGSVSDRVLNIRVAANKYQLSHENGDGTGGVFSSAAAAPAIGDTVEVRAVLNADGSVQLGQTINGAAEVVASASGSKALAATWFGNTLLLAPSSFAAFLVPYKVAFGVQSLGYMRALVR